MKIQVAKQDLEAAVNVVSPCVAGKGSVISAHYLFRRDPADRTKAQVLSHSVRISALCPLTAVVEESEFDAFTVEGWRLKMWLDTLPDAALEFEFDGSVVEVFCPGKGKQKFQSLDPSKYPYWDKGLADAEETATLSAERLHRALDYTHNFTSDNESREPHLCVCEAKDGILAATNKRTATMVTVAGLKKSLMRIHTKDVPAILSFLATIEGDVEVLEHERRVFFRRVDGAVFEETRFDANFPSFSRPPDDSPHWWVLRTEDIRGAIPFLVSGASKEDDRLRLSRPDDGSAEPPIILSMMTATGGTATQEVECLESGMEDGAEEIPPEGFVLAHPNLSKMLQFVDSDTVKVALSRRLKSGYMRFVDHFFKNDDGSGGDEYLTVLAWLR